MCSNREKGKNVKLPPIHKKLDEMQRTLRTGVITADELYNIGAFIPYVNRLYPPSGEEGEKEDENDKGDDSGLAKAMGECECSCERE